MQAATSSEVPPVRLRGHPAAPQRAEDPAHDAGRGPVLHHPGAGEPGRSVPGPQPLALLPVQAPRIPRHAPVRSAHVLKHDPLRPARHREDMAHRHARGGGCRGREVGEVAEEERANVKRRFDDLDLEMAGCPFNVVRALAWSGAAHAVPSRLPRVPRSRATCAGRKRLPLDTLKAWDTRLPKAPPFSAG